MTRFEKFLYNRGLLEAFENNIKAHYIRCRTIDELITYEVSVDYIYMAFRWRYTLEGSEFWRTINEEWINSPNKL